MGLSTDIFFVKALQDTPSVNDAVGGRIFNPARSTVDEEEDRLPYIIVNFDKLTNEESTKDNANEGDTDIVDVSITICAEDRVSLATLAKNVRDAINDYFNNLDAAEAFNLDAPNWWRFSTDAVYYEEGRPCVYTKFYYSCDTNSK